MSFQKTFLFTAALATAGVAFAQEQGRVISVTPVFQQVAVPQQNCVNSPAVVQRPTSGAGAVMGALAGGALGNAVGGGTGKAAATLLGLVGGAALGNNIESGGAQVQNVPTCSTQMTYENRATGYNVTYEYNGRQYTTQMANDPGQYVQLQVSPVGAQTQPPVSSAPPQTFYGAPATTYVAPAVTYAAPPVVYSNPGYYYGPSYYPYPAVSFGIGIGYGYHGHRHWR